MEEASGWGWVTGTGGSSWECQICWERLSAKVLARWEEETNLVGLTVMGSLLDGATLKICKEILRNETLCVLRAAVFFCGCARFKEDISLKVVRWSSSMRLRAEEEIQIFWLLVGGIG